MKNKKIDVESLQYYDIEKLKNLFPVGEEFKFYDSRAGGDIVMNCYDIPVFDFFAIIENTGNGNYIIGPFINSETFMYSSVLFGGLVVFTGYSHKVEYGIGEELTCLPNSQYSILCKSQSLITIGHIKLKKNE